MKPCTHVTLDGMEILQIRMMEIQLRHSAKHGYSIGVHPKAVRNTVAYWLNRIGHKGMSPRASWKRLHAEWIHVFGAVIDDTNDTETSTTTTHEN